MNIIKKYIFINLSIQYSGIVIDDYDNGNIF